MTGTATTAVATRSARLDAGSDISDGDARNGRGRPGERGRSRARGLASLASALGARSVALADEPVAALSPLEARDGRKEVGLGEVRPEHVGEEELGVGQAVEEKVRDAPLSAGADDEVGIADREARHVRAQRFGRHVVRAYPACGDRAGKLARGVRDLLAPS